MNSPAQPSATASQPGPLASTAPNPEDAPHHQPAAPTASPVTPPIATAWHSASPVTLPRQPLPAHPALKPSWSDEDIRAKGTATNPPVIDPNPASWKGRAHRVAIFVREKRYALPTASTIASFLIRHFTGCANLPICNSVGLLADFPPNICNLVEGVASIAVIICARPHREANKRAAATVVTFIPITTSTLRKELADMMEDLALDIGSSLLPPFIRNIRTTPRLFLSFSRLPVEASHLPGRIRSELSSTIGCRIGTSKGKGEKIEGSRLQVMTLNGITAQHCR
jgi:hypothetical protein